MSLYSISLAVNDVKLVLLKALLLFLQVPRYIDNIDSRSGNGSRMVMQYTATVHYTQYSCLNFRKSMEEFSVLFSVQFSLYF